jgi:hypothetical protein
MSKTRMTETRGASIADFGNSVIRILNLFRASCRGSRSLSCCTVSYLGLVLALVGCGGSRTSPVAGVVVLDGQPLAEAAIQFVPQGAGRDATGQTDTNGEFAMSTFEPRDGVLPGTYKVVITPPTGVVDTTKYATVEEAMAAASKPQARPAPKGPSVPAKYTRLDQTPLTQAVPVVGKLRIELLSK